jgi:hypothetical protein
LIFSTGCGWKPGSKSGGNRNGSLPQEPQTAMLSILTQWPEDQDQQIPADAAIAVRFDAPLHPGSLDDGLSYLEVRDTRQRVACDLSLRDQGTTLVLDPVRDLQHETWYVCHLSPLLVDQQERLLEEDRLFAFCTADVTPPRSTSISVRDGAKAVDRAGRITLHFSEPLDPQSINADTVVLRDAGGAPHPIDRRLLGAMLECELVRDLLPEHRYTLTVLAGPNGVRDPAGNALASDITSSFTTTTDDSAPRLVRTYPFNQDASANVQVLLHFDESMDIDSIESTAFTFKDQHGNWVAHDVLAGDDQKLIRLVPRGWSAATTRSGSTTVPARSPTSAASRCRTRRSSTSWSGPTRSRRGWSMPVRAMAPTGSPTASTRPSGSTSHWTSCGSTTRRSPWPAKTARSRSMSP